MWTRTATNQRSLKYICEEVNTLTWHWIRSNVNLGIEWCQQSTEKDHFLKSKVDTSSVVKMLHFKIVLSKGNCTAK